jgi:hypothetical protein
LDVEVDEDFYIFLKNDCVLEIGWVFKTCFLTKVSMYSEILSVGCWFAEMIGLPGGFSRFL